MTTEQQLDFIADTFAARETISMSAVEKALSLLDQAPQEALQMIVDRKIKFLWVPAKRRLDAMTK